MSSSLSPLEILENRTNAKWTHVQGARTLTQTKLEQLKQSLADDLPGLDSDSDVALILFGSLARREFTPGSDIDWTLLVDGPANPDHFQIAQTIRQRLIDAKLKKPGREGVFGSLAFSHELVHQIGGEDDTNRNTTRRVLLLFEAVPLGPCGDRNAHHRVVRSVLKRYIGEDRTFVEARSHSHVPRFLLNDLARYWRTLCVDFAYKARDGGGEGSAIRNVKLRMSRKLLYASGLLTCFGCELGILRRPTERECARPDCVSPEGCVSCLEQALKEPPLDRVASAILYLTDGKNSSTALDTGKKIFDAYNAFLGILADETGRQQLENLERFEDDGHFKTARRLSHDFRDGLQALFFGVDPTLAKLTQTYGVF